MALTVEQLDAMGVGQIVLDRDGEEWTASEVGWARQRGMFLHKSKNLVAHYGPIRQKGWPPFTEDDAERARNKGKAFTLPSIYEEQPSLRAEQPMLTATELDAMDVGQIVVDRVGEEWTRQTSGMWVSADGEMYVNGLGLSCRGARRREAHVEQPMPTASTGPSMHDLAVQVHGDRAQTGLARYGQPLRAMNGRDAVRDTIEELADGLAYALQIREERRLLRAELDLLADKCVDADPFACTELRDIITRYFPEES